MTQRADAPRSPRERLEAAGEVYGRVWRRLARGLVDSARGVLGAGLEGPAGQTRAGRRALARKAARGGLAREDMVEAFAEAWDRLVRIGHAAALEDMRAALSREGVRVDDRRRINTGREWEADARDRYLIAVELGPAEARAFADLRRAWVAEQGRIAATFRLDFAIRLADRLEAAAAAGDGFRGLDSILSELGASFEARGTRTAADQVWRGGGEVGAATFREAGLESYVWETQQDARVRESHRRRQGKTYTWATGSEEGTHPGEEINCRCWARPVVRFR